MQKTVFAITPPFTQLNTPYPATAYLKGFLNTKNIASTQSRLIKGLENLIRTDEKYLLDGHFCLLNSEGIPNRIDEDTFDQINLKAIAIVIDVVEKIAKRLEARDGKIYDVKVLNELQQMEIEYAKYLSDKYSIPYIEIKDRNYTQLMEII